MKRLRIIGLVILALIVAGATYVVISAVLANTITRQELRSALVDYCHHDLRFKRQYKKRAISERRSESATIRSDLDTARAWDVLAEVSRALTQGSDPRTVSLLNTLADGAHRATSAYRDTAARERQARSLIHIIPIGACSQIERTG